MLVRNAQELGPRCYWVGEVELVSIGSDAAAWLAGGVASKEIIGRLLGPTADYFGDATKSFVEKRAENIRAILGYAIRVAKGLDEQGSVPAKVLRDVINDGSMCDDPLSLEYYGGVLASSRTGISRDDRAATITAAIGRLSTYQIRAHYVFYHCIRRCHVGAPSVNINFPQGRAELLVFIPFETIIVAMDLIQAEADQFDLILNHVMFGLAREELIDAQNFRYGSPENLGGFVSGDLGRGGVLLGPSALGAEMFVRAYGNAVAPASFLRADLDFPLRTEVTIQPNCRKP